MKQHKTRQGANTPGQAGARQDLGDFLERASFGPALLPAFTQ